MRIHRHLTPFRLTAAYFITGMAGAWLAACAVAGAEPPTSAGDYLPSSVLEFASPPTRTPSTTAVDGALLGNGDMKVAVAGKPERQQFHLGKNDLWFLKHGYGAGSPVTLGHLEIAIPALQGASYAARLPLASPALEATFTKDGLTVRQRSMVLAQQNLLWIRLEAEGGTVEVVPRLAIQSGKSSQVAVEAGNGLFYGVRHFDKPDADIASGVAVAMRLLGAELREHNAESAVPTTARHRVEVGREQAQGGRWGFDGKIDELRVDAAALGEPDVAAVRDGRYPAKPALQWSFEQLPDGAHNASLVPGKRGLAVQLAASQKSRIEVGVVDLPRTPVTISAWIYLDQTDRAANYILSCGKWNQGISLGISSGKLRFTADGHFADSAALPLKKWVHVAGSWDGSHIDLFLDGEQVSEKRSGSAALQGAAITLKPGKPVDLLLAMDSLFDSTDYQQRVQHVATALSATDLPALERLHSAWWADYWRKSWIEIGDPALELAYYRSLYGMGACSRNPRFPPGIFGWDTTDTPGWQGDYHLNYNHFAPFYALAGANRFEQMDPEVAPLLDFLQRAKWYAANVTKTRGALYPVGIGPLGIETTRDAARYASGGRMEKGGLFHHQRSNGAYGLVNTAERWRTSYDLAYARKTYPLVLEIANFWEDYLKFEGDRYVIVGDAIHEGSGFNVNPILSLGLVRNAFDLALDMSRELKVDAERRKKWEHILLHLSAWPTQQVHGKTVFRYTEKGPSWYRGNTLGIQHIYPANGIGLDSDPKDIEIARNTLEAMNRWFDYNGSNSFFPAAARVGYDPQVILEHLRTYNQRTYANGFQRGNVHGIENLSTVPNTLNAMLCMGCVPIGNPRRAESVLRVFPVWPREIDARFHQIRVWGAFLVTSALKAGEVRFVRITSEGGRLCTIVNPWPGAKVQLRGQDRQETLSGERFSFTTSKGEVVELVKVE